MNISAPFIRRPIGTALLALGLFLVGAVAYGLLPVASLPSVDLPTVRVAANLAGASPETMAATVAAPLERRIGEIAGLTELTSTSSLGSTSVVAQFELGRSADDAARDVQAAISAARVDLPSSFARAPTVRKANPAALPVLILAMTSDVRPPSAVYDAADLIVATRIAQVAGVAEVSVGGSAQPAYRVAADPDALRAKGLGLSDLRTAIAEANVQTPLGRLDGVERGMTLGSNGRLAEPEDYGAIVLRTADGEVLRLRDVATVERGTSNRLNAGWYDERPAVLLIVQKTPDANVVQTVDAIRAALPEIEALLPSGIRLALLADRTNTIRTAVHDLQLTLVASAALVMLVVFLFLRRGVPTLAAGITVPLSLAGTVALMWLVGFSLDNMSLLALTISVGFVVDDAIVMIENAYSKLEAGLSPAEAALEGAGQIGFTVVSISLSLVAAFIPLIFMGDVMGRLIREFALTLTFSILVSAVVSLTVTPAICAHLIRRAPRPRETWLDRLIEPFLDRVTAAYARSLRHALAHGWAMLAATVLALGLSAALYVAMPKSLLPQGDTGLLIGSVEGAPDVSFAAMSALQQRVTAIIARDPDVAGVGSSVGSSGGGGAGNRGRLFVSLKPEGERRSTVFEVIDRLRDGLRPITGIEVSLYPAQEIGMGGRSTRSRYQYTLWGPDLGELTLWVPRVRDAIRGLPGVVDVALDRDRGGPEARVVVDRVKAARLGVSVAAVNEALNDAFGQRRVSTIRTARSQQDVILEIDRRHRRDANGLARVHVTGADGARVPLPAVTRTVMTTAPLAVNHQGQFPAITLSYNLTEDTALGDATSAVTTAVERLQLPEGIRTAFAGEALSQAATESTQPLLVLAALLSVYLILGILYESLIHPLTIISTLPSAGLGAALALVVTGTDFSLLALIGIMLLIGIVKKNGIMLVDFALDAERRRGLSPERAIREACVERFRPITMTTLAAILGAVPLIVASGAGSELRRPLGITIVGGLVASQIFTIYTTPVIYLFLDRLRPARRRGAVRAA